jgi:hypothetical protein
MHFAFTHNRRDDKPKCLILGLNSRNISVSYRSNTTTKSVEVAANSFALSIRSPYPRMKQGSFLNKESVAKG